MYYVLSCPPVVSLDIAFSHSTLSLGSYEKVIVLAEYVPEELEEFDCDEKKAWNLRYLRCSIYPSSSAFKRLKSIGHYLYFSVQFIVAEA